MLDEISAAVHFLVRLIGKSGNFNSDQLQDFQNNLSDLLVKRFENHWFPDQPCKGQGYRCIRVNERDRRDITIELAARACGLKYEDLKLPVELTVWVDPNEVSCRFGEHRGSYCTLASFMGKENKNNPTIDTTLASFNGNEKKSNADCILPSFSGKENKNIAKVDFSSGYTKDTKSEVTPLGLNGNSVNKNYRSPTHGNQKHNHLCGLRGKKNWNNQGHLNGGFPQSMHSWYTLIPQWLPPSPPPCHHSNSLLHSSGMKWNNQMNRNQNWPSQKGTLRFSLM